MKEEQKTMGGEASFKACIAKGPCWLAKRIDFNEGRIYQQHFEKYDDAFAFGESLQNVIDGEEVYYRQESFFDLQEYKERCAKFSDYMSTQTSGRD